MNENIQLRDPETYVALDVLGGFNNEEVHDIARGLIDIAGAREVVVVEADHAHLRYTDGGVPAPSFMRLRVFMPLGMKPVEGYMSHERNADLLANTLLDHESITRVTIARVGEA